MFTQAVLRVGSQGAQEGKKQGEANANSLGGTLWKSGKVQSFLFQVAFTLLTSGRGQRGTWVTESREKSNKQISAETPKAGMSRSCFQGVSFC